jgi:hypothetical protein
VQDPFNPLGRADQLEAAQLLVAAAHLDVPTAYTLVSAGARAAMGLPPVRVEAGFPADLLAVAGSSLREAIASRTTPTLNVFVIPIGVVSSPDSRTHSSPVSSPFPFNRCAPANNGSSGGTTTVTPVRTSSRSTTVAWPTRTPATSASESSRPGSSAPILIPSAGGFTRTSL